MFFYDLYDPGHAKRDNKVKEYDQVLLNIKQNKPVFENVNKKYNAFIMGSHYKNELKNLHRDYPKVKIILTNRNDNVWVISMKNHLLVANRSNPKRTNLIKNKTDFRDSVKNQLNDLKFFVKENFLELNVDDKNKHKTLCNFLNIDVNKFTFEYPHISTNKKLTLTQEQIDF